LSTAAWRHCRRLSRWRRARLADLGQEIPSREDQNPQTLAAYHKAEIEKWWPILKAANIKGE
jgi:hypothetical protein